MNGHAPQDALRHPLAAALGVAALLLGACSEPADDGMNAEDAAPAVDTAMVTDHASDAPGEVAANTDCLLYTSPSPRDKRQSRMPSSA